MSTQLQSADIPENLLGSARSYCKLGWPVMPVRGKTPILKKWPDQASSDASKAVEWFNGTQNIGIVTGEKSNLVVLDIDPRNGGDATLKDLICELGALPDTVSVDTGGGGKHYYFRYFEGARKGTLDDGVDILAEGGYVVAPPSKHPKTQRLYTWNNGPDTPVAELPEQWKERILRKGAAKKADIDPDDQSPIPEGSRNSILFNLGVSYAKVANKFDALWLQLVEINEVRCQPPLSEDEVAGIAERCWKFKRRDSALFYWQQSMMASDMSEKDKCALWALSSFANNQTLFCYPNQDQIAARCGTTKKTAALRLENYEGDWFFTSKRNIGGGVFSYGYRLNKDKISNKALGIE